MSIASLVHTGEIKQICNRLEVDCLCIQKTTEAAEMIERTVEEDARNVGDGTGVNTEEVSKDPEPDEDMEREENTDVESEGGDSIDEHVDTGKLLKELSQLGKSDSEGSVMQRGKRIGLRRITTRSKARANQTEQ